MKWSCGTVAGLIILAAVLTGLFRVAANIVPGYHDDIEQRISAQIGSPVVLGKISLVWHGWGPALAFNDVKVLNSRTQAAVLSAERLRLDFTLFSLIHGADARPYAIHIQAPAVTLRQMPDGSIVIPGLSLSTDGGVGLKAMLKDQIHVEEGKITLHLSGKPAWTFNAVNLSIDGGKKHEVELSARLPAALGGRMLYVDGRVETQQADPERWRWQIYYNLRQVPLATVRDFLPGSWDNLRGTLALNGQARGVGGKMTATQGSITLGGLGAGRNRLKSLRSQYALDFGTGVNIALQDSVLVTAKQTLEPGSIKVGWDLNGFLDVSVAQLDLGVLAPLSHLLPASLDALARRLQLRQPVGTIKNLSLSLKSGDISTLALTAHLQDIGVQPFHGIPGVSHLSGQVSLQQGMGIFNLDAPDLTLFLPGIYPHPVALKRVTGKIALVLNDAGVRVAAPRLNIRGAAGLDGWAMARIDVPNQGPVVVHLAATQPAAMDAVAARAHYLPASLLPDPLVEWLMTQLDGGQVGRASMRFIGPAAQFPFYEGQGLFSVRFGYRGVSLTPGKGWVPLRALSGSIHFKNAGMIGTVDAGTIVNAMVKRAKITIPDLADPLLTVSTDVKGSVDDFIAFLKDSPIAEEVPFEFKQVEADGAARTRLQLTLPVSQPNQFKLTGELVLADAMLKLSGRPYALQHINGRVNFDRHGPAGGHIEARLFDTPVDIELGRTQNADNKQLLHISLHADFPVETLGKVAEVDLSPYVSGFLPLQAIIALPLVGKAFPLDINLTSNLQGLAVTLPAPAGKPAQTSRPFILKLHVMRKGAQLRTRYTDVGSFCSFITQRDEKLALSVAEVKLGSGLCELPQHGYQLVGGWSVLNVGEWVDVMSEVLSPDAASSSSALPVKRFWSRHGLRAKLHFGRVNLLDRALRNQSIGAWLVDDQLRLQLQGPDLIGKVIIPHHPSNDAPILVKLEKLHIAAPAVSTTNAVAATTKAAPVAATQNQAVVKAKEQSGLRPRDIPPFSVHVTRLELGDAVLDGVNISARHVPSGVIFKPIRVDDGVLSMNGQLVWLHPDKGSQGAFQMLAHVHKLGDLLQGFGMDRIITANGAISAALAWQEPKDGEFAQGLLGKVSMDLRDGNIAEVKAGAGRLLSLLNLANIPRYLVFDFHSLFGEGFPFSRIYGDYHIKQGIAHTKAFRIDSSVADIKLVGTINLVEGTIDQTAYVQPNYFGSLPVIGALVGGLGVGAAIFVLAKVFGHPLGKAFELEYSIEGPITNPVVKPVGDVQPTNPQRAPAASSTSGLQ